MTVNGMFPAIISRRGLLRVAAGAVPALAAPRPARAADSKVVIAVSTDFETLDPTVNHAIIGWPIRLNVFDALTDIAPDGSLRPRLATSWQSSPDARSWTFTLRPGAHFQDGSPITIDDVIWSFQKIIDDPKTPTRTYVSMVKSIDRVSDAQVRFNLAIAFAPFDRQVVIIRIVPRTAYLAMGAEQFGKTPIGSGPYKVVSWVKDDHVELAAFDGYWGGRPAIETATIRPIPSEASRAAALLSGEVDIVPALSPAQVKTLSSRPRIKVSTADGYKVVYLGFNPATPALKDLRLRQAIDHAVDRDAITGKLLRGMAQPDGQIVAPVTFGYDSAIKPTPYDPDLAKSLVRQSGYGGEPILIQYPNDFIASADDVAQAVAGYLGAVGINVTLQSMDYNSFYGLWSARKLSAIHLFVFAPSLLDADVPIFSIFATFGQRGYLFDPRVDALADQQRAEADPIKRKALIAELFETANTYQPFAFLYNERQAYGVRAGVNWKAGPDGIVRLLDVSLDAGQ